MDKDKKEQEKTQKEALESKKKDQKPADGELKTSDLDNVAGGAGSTGFIPIERYYD